MLKSKINTMFSELDIKVCDIAEFAKTDVTNISRLKSGSRTPKPSSATINKLADGIIEYCTEYSKTEKLDKLISFEGGSRKEALIEWLFDDYNKTENSQALFASKLGAVMKLCGVSIKALSAKLNIDVSYLSRIRSGKRTLNPNNELYEAISRELFDEIAANGSLEKLRSFINSECEINSPSFYYEFRSWLCDFGRGDRHIKELLDSIGSLEIPKALPVDISKLDFSYEEKSCYFGNKGLQNAVIRFLTEVINSDTREVFLYSDRSIDWMTGEKEFAVKWAVLMKQLVSKGITVKIIHNIDRKIPDMVSAIRSWLPIYMSCQIEPYYTNSKSGNRFTHTLFVCPKVACVKAFNLPYDESPEFDYFTDTEHIQKSCEIFNNMLEKCMPLMYARKGVITNGALIYKDDDKSNIEISMDEISVTVSRLDEPRVSFTVLNNLLANAIKSYCADYEVQRKMLDTK